MGLLPLSWTTLLQAATRKKLSYSVWNGFIYLGWMESLAATSFLSCSLTNLLKTVDSSIFLYSRKRSRVDYRIGITFLRTFQRMPSEKGAVVSDPVYVHRLLYFNSSTNLVKSSIFFSALGRPLDSMSILRKKLS